MVSRTVAHRWRGRRHCTLRARLRYQQPNGGARRRRRCSRTPAVLLPSTAAGEGDGIGRLRHPSGADATCAQGLHVDPPRITLSCAMDSAASEAAVTTHRHRPSCHPKVAPASGESESPTSPPPPCSARRRVTRSAATHTGVSHLHLPILPQQRRGRQQLSLVSSYV